MADHFPRLLDVRAACRGLLALSILTQAAPGADPYVGPLPQVFQADFARGTFDVQSLALAGGHAEELVHAEPAGLRIKIPPNMNNPESVGIKTRFRVRGDFDLSASFEILQADKPTQGYGIGAQMSIETDSPTKEAVTAEWTYTPGRDGTRFISTRIVGQADGQRQYNVKSLPANRRAGTVRLVRSGPMVQAYYRDEGELIERSLPPVELGTEDVTSIKVAANTGISDHPVEIRLRSLTIAADELPGWSGATISTTPGRTGPGPGARLWKPIGIGVAVAALVGGLFASFGVAARRKGAEQPARKTSTSRGDEPAAKWEDEPLAALEALAREYARTHPDSEIFFEPGHYQFTLREGVLDGPGIVWWKVAVDELKRPGQTWDELRRQLPKRYRGRYREGRRDGAFQTWDSTGGTIIVRFVEGARS